MRRAVAWSVLAALLALCVLVRVGVSRGLDGALALGAPGEAIGWRLGAVQSAALCGAALALCGLLLQGMLRNPLASPFVLGMTGGSQAAVSLAMVVAWRAGGGVSGAMQLVFGTLGGVGALLLCVAFGRSRSRGIDPVSLVLAGVVVAAMAGSVSTLCEWMLPPGERLGLAAWGMGRIPEMPDRAATLALGATLALVLAWAVANARTLDAMQLSDDEASSLGVNLAATRRVVVLATGLLAACATALCGPLAFVGLVAPHMARGLLGGSHRRTAIGAVLAGAALLVGADAIRALVPVDGGRLPVGVVCALAGGPAFLVLLRRGVTEAWRA